MTTFDAPYGSITWVLCVPDARVPNRIVPYLHERRGTVWFSEPQYIDRFLREHPGLPPGARSRAVIGDQRLLTLARDLLRAGVSTLYYDLEYGKESPGTSLGEFARQLEERLGVAEAVPGVGELRGVPLHPRGLPESR